MTVDEEAFKAAEKELSAAFEKWARVGGYLEETFLLTNWVMVAATVDMEGEDWSRVLIAPSANTPFWQQSGLINYANNRYTHRTGCGHVSDGDA